MPVRRVSLLAGLLFAEAACLGDVPPFQGEGGAGGAPGVAATSGGPVASSSSASTATSGPSASSGGGGPPSTSATTSSSGGGGGAEPCNLGEPPHDCAEAFQSLGCAGLGHPESCEGVPCPEGDCQYLASVALNDEQAVYCRRPGGAIGAACLECDGVGPALAVLPDFDQDGDPIVIGSFDAGTASLVKIHARGSGSFALEWWATPSSFSASPTHTLTDEIAGYDVGFPPSTSFELRIVPMSDALWIEIDCAYVVGTASSGVAH